MMPVLLVMALVLPAMLFGRVDELRAVKELSFASGRILVSTCVLAAFMVLFMAGKL